MTHNPGQRTRPQRFAWLVAVVLFLAALIGTAAPARATDAAPDTPAPDSPAADAPVTDVAPDTPVTDAAPANDNWAQAKAWSPVSPNPITGSTVDATRQAGEPNHANKTGLHSAWWSYTPNNDRLVKISTIGSSFDTIMGVYTGTAVNQLSHVASNDDNPSGALESVVTFFAKAGTKYTIAVDGFNGLQGTVKLTFTVTTPVGAEFHPVTPFRILDSRTTTGGWNATLNAGSPKDLKVRGQGGANNIPSQATAIVMNVTATGSNANSFVTAYPKDTPLPTASNLNFGPGETIPNLVTVKIGAGGNVTFANAVGSVHLIADIVGWYDNGTLEGARFTGVSPNRVLDSRTTAGGWNNSPLEAGTPRTLAVRKPQNANGVPSTATAVVANVTVTGATAPSFITVWPNGVAQPSSSNLNFNSGQTIPNLVTVRIGTSGAIKFANAVGSAHVIVDIVGYYDPNAGSRFYPIEPKRVLDSRSNFGVPGGAWGKGVSRAVPLAGISSTNVPGGSTAIVTNVTATSATAGTFITVFPAGPVRPTSSNLNVAPGQTIPNLVAVKTGENGQIELYNEAGTVHLIADVVGYFGF